MDFDLTDEQKAIQNLAREFAQDEVRPRAEEMDREERFPYELDRERWRNSASWVCRFPKSTAAPAPTR